MLIGIILLPSYVYARMVSLPTRYVLYGVASLEYEKDWVFNSDFSNEHFTQNYQLGITGPVIDPRLITFDINGTLTDSSGDVDSEIKGFNATLRLLNFGFIKSGRYDYLNYLPRPIVLRYSRYDGDNFKNTSYGISTSYYLPFNIKLFGNGELISFRSIFAQPQRMKFNQQVGQNDRDNANGNANGNTGNANGNTNGNAKDNQQQVQQVKKVPYEGINIPFPVINFDFDRNIYTSGEDKTISTSYDTRMRFGGRKYDYTVGYFVNLNEDSRYLYDRKQENFTIDTRNELHSWIFENNFRQEKIKEMSEINSISLNSRLSRYFQPNPETYFGLSLGGSYSKSETTTGSSESESISAGATLGKRLSSYLQSGTSLFVNYQETSNSSEDNKSFYSINVQETLSYTGYRGLLLTASANGGYSDEAVPYGVSVGFITTKWRRLSLGGNYQYDRNINKENYTITQKHQLRYNASAILRQNMSINAGVTNSIALVNDKYNDISYSERTNSLDIGLRWFYRKHSFDISGFVTRSATTNPATSTPESEIYGYRIFYNTSFLPRTLYSIFFTHDFDKTNNKSVDDLKTAFSWYYGKVIFTADYEIKNTKDSQTDITEYRIFLKISRYFRKVL